MILQRTRGAAQLERTAEDLREIGEGAASITVHGNRYPEALQRLVGR